MDFVGVGCIALQGVRWRSAQTTARSLHNGRFKISVLWIRLQRWQSDPCKLCFVNAAGSIVYQGVQVKRLKWGKRHDMLTV